MLGFTVAFVLLAEAMVAVALGRNWQASWWEWHLLMLLAFAVIAVMAHQEGTEERFGRLYVDRDAQPVTVLFADLKGFTSYSEHHDPATVSRMLDTLFGAAIPAIERHTGVVDRLIGDAVFATFEGDNHAERAGRAALALQAETGVLAAEHPDWPRFRAGLHTGRGVRRRARHRQRPHLQRHRRHGQPRLPDRGPGACGRRRDQRRDGEAALGRRDGAARHRPGEGARGAGRGAAAAEAASGLSGPGLRIRTPSTSGGRIGAPHSSHSTAKADGNGAEHSGQRCRVSPPQCGQAAGSSASPSRK